MPASEQKRLALRNRLIEVLGEEEASTLMESLPPVYWHDLVTKDDIKDTNEAIEASEQRLRTEMHAGFTNIRTEMNGIRTEMNGKFAKVDAEFTKLRGEIALQFAKQTRTMVFTMLGLAVPILGTILAVGLS